MNTARNQMLNMKNSASNVIENGAKVPQQLFEAKDKISALESAQRALQTRLADDAERRAGN